MLFWIGLGVLLIGGIVARIASKRGDEGEALKKVGIALIFIGTAILLFVLTINILVWTGRFGVASLSPCPPTGASFFNRRRV